MGGRPGGEEVWGGGFLASKFIRMSELTRGRAQPLGDLRFGCAGKVSAFR